MKFCFLVFLLSSVATHSQDSGSSKAFKVEVCAAPRVTTVTDALICGEPVMRFGSPVEVTVRFSNNSNRIIDASGAWSNLTRYDPNWEFDVRDSKGTPVLRRHYPHEELASGSVFSRNVLPGRSLKDNVDLARIFDFQKPGDYTVKVIRLVPLEKPQRSNEIKVESSSIVITISPNH